MGKKRTHAETKDGFTKPAPDKSRMSAQHDKKDKRKSGAKEKPRSQLVCSVAMGRWPRY
jgi:ribosome biogenesis protein MAK21